MKIKFPDIKPLGIGDSQTKKPVEPAVGDNFGRIKFMNIHKLRGFFLP